MRVMADNERPSSESSSEKLSRLLTDWREVFSRCVDEAEKFTREKPSMGLAVAFFAGAVFGSLLRKR